MRMNTEGQEAEINEKTEALLWKSETQMAWLYGYHANP